MSPGALCTRCNEGVPWYANSSPWSEKGEGDLQPTGGVGSRIRQMLGVGDNGLREGMHTEKGRVTGRSAGVIISNAWEHNVAF